MNNFNEVLTMYCPHCETDVIVEARMMKLEYVKANIEKSPRRELILDWDSADIAGDFEYVCPQCSHVFGESLDDLEYQINMTAFCEFCSVGEGPECVECLYHEANKDKLTRYLQQKEGR